MKTILLFLVLSFSFLTQAQQNTQSQPPRKRVGNIDPSEKEKYRTRYEALDSRYFSLGPAFGTNLNNKDMLYAFTIGYEWEVGAQGAILAEANGIFGDGTAFINGGIGGKYFFSDEDTSLFAKGLFGMGSASAKSADTASGFSGKFGIGMTFFRTSTKHLEIAADYATLFKSNSEGNPGLE